MIVSRAVLCSLFCFLISLPMPFVLFSLGVSSTGTPNSPRQQVFVSLFMLTQSTGLGKSIPFSTIRTVPSFSGELKYLYHLKKPYPFDRRRHLQINPP